MTRTLQIKTAPIFKPLLKAARYKGIWGGRGSGKSHFFADCTIEDSLYHKGMRTICIREVQKSLKESVKLLIEDKLREFRLGEADGFKVFREVIETPGDGLISFTGMNNQTAESIKSLQGYRRAWVEEAQGLSSRSLSLLRPTIREDDAEFWFSWNPRRKSDAVDKMLRGENPPTGAITIRANWNDNPWFPKALEQERQDCLQSSPEEYEHIWEGGYATILAGAYYAKYLATAKAEGRIGNLARDPLLPIRAFWDIGGTGMDADATSIWICQFVGREIRVLDYYEAQGQPLDIHVQWLRDNGYGKAVCILPHDGAQNEKTRSASFQSLLEEADFETDIVENMGRGAAKLRIEAARRIFGSIWFDDKKTAPGRDALGWYHEKKDEERQLGLGPNHDWSSHAADAFGMMCVAYEQPEIQRRKAINSYRGEGAWMG